MVIWLTSPNGIALIYILKGEVGGDWSMVIKLKD